MIQYRIALDLSKNSPQAVITTKKGEAQSREVVFTLHNRGEEIRPELTSGARIWAKKPDGTVLYNNCTVYSDRIVYALTSQTVAAAGAVECELQILGENGEILYSPRFTMIVENILYDSSTVESADEYDTVIAATRYMHIKYAGKEPTADADMSDIPSEYIGLAVTSSSTAPTAYSSYSWYQWKGPKGEQGETGATGPKGETGATGATGPQGEKGEKGETGAAGAQGAQGEKGERGERGPQGIGITSIVKTDGTGTPGTSDTYTITFGNNEETATFTVQNGADGEQGTTGADGEDGSVWFSGTVVSGIGNNISAGVNGSRPGDYYLNTDSCNVYRATAANVWSYQTNIRGASGSGAGDMLAAQYDTNADGTVNAADVANELKSLAGGGIAGIIKRTGAGNYSVAQPGNDYAAAAHTHAEYLATSGGAMTGPLTLAGTPSAMQEATTKGYVDTAVGGVTAAGIGAVPQERTVNGKALSGDIALTAEDTGARPVSWTPDAEEVGAVPQTRTVNGKALSENITLRAEDVGARAADWTPSVADIGAVPTSRKINGNALISDITLSAFDIDAVPTYRLINGFSLKSDVYLSAHNVDAVPNARTVNGKALSGDITLAASDVGAAGVLEEIESGKTESFTIDAAALGKTYLLGNTADLTVTLPTQSAVELPVGFGFYLRRWGSGGVTVAGESETVTLNGGTAGLTLGEQYTAVVSVVKVAENAWAVNGGLA